MTIRHAEAPWKQHSLPGLRVGYSPSVPCIGILNNRDYIAYVPTGAWDNTRSKKDACLIVASPKLLSSLRKVVDHFSSRAEQNTRALEIIEEARALIKEAEGSDVQPQ